MEHAMFIVAHAGAYHGPFLRDEVDYFTSSLTGVFEVVPLTVPRSSREQREPMRLQVLAEGEHQAFVDGFKVDTSHVLAGTTQIIHFARREERVLTAHELVVMQSDLFAVAQAIKSLMHHAEVAVADPSPDNVAALRKAFWRNRGSDDVDPHYQDRFW